MAVAEAQNRLALALADGGVSVWTLGLGRDVRRINAGPVTALAFSSDGKTLATGSDDGAVDLWDADRGKRLVSLAAGGGDVRGLTLSADDSLVQIETDTDSRSISTKGGNGVLRLAGSAAFHPSQLLIAAADATSGRVIATAKASFGTALVGGTTKAETSSDSDDFQRAYNVKDLGGGVEEMRLYQNGKLVSSQAGADNPSGFTAKLAQGPNEFRLVALSRDRIESRPAKVKVTYTGAERKSTLHVVAIGINKYKNPALNLNYGVGDAQGIAD